jgi:hypothetical protein
MKIKKSLLVFILMLSTAGVYAACTSKDLIDPSGLRIVCTTCCEEDGKNCITQCVPKK